MTRTMETHPPLEAASPASVADGRQLDRRNMSQDVKSRGSYKAWQVSANTELPQWVRPVLYQLNKNPTGDFPEPPNLVIRTDSGLHKIYEGQWIVWDSDTNRYWSVQSSEFSTIYEEAA